MSEKDPPIRPHVVEWLKQLPDGPNLKKVLADEPTRGNSWVELRVRLQAKRRALVALGAEPGTDPARLADLEAEIEELERVLY